jgi:hypothetical protein
VTVVFELLRPFIEFEYTILEFDERRSVERLLNKVLFVIARRFNDNNGEFGYSKPLSLRVIISC